MKEMIGLESRPFLITLFNVLTNHLDGRDAARLCQVSKRFREAIHDNTILARLMFIHYIEANHPSDMTFLCGFERIPTSDIDVFNTLEPLQSVFKSFFPLDGYHYDFDEYRIWFKCDFYQIDSFKTKEWEETWTEYLENLEIAPDSYFSYRFPTLPNNQRCPTDLGEFHRGNVIFVCFRWKEQSRKRIRL
jgi:hypothetical protein